MQPHVRYMPFGDSALLVEFGNTVNTETNKRVLALSSIVETEHLEGVKEVVPTYRSFLVGYDPSRVSYERLVFLIREIEEKTLALNPEAVGRKLVVPVVYGGEYGPDLKHIAEIHNLKEQQVVRLHVEKEYRVYMIGFTAGFPYLGEVADEIATPRLETPRLKVPAGSVGIAEKQTGIYPYEAPGGWQIIGRTPLRLFDPSKQPPALLKAGDIVTFKQIAKDTFNNARESLHSGKAFT